MENQQNPYLDIFLENSRKVRNEIISDSKLIEKIKEKLLIKKNLGESLNYMCMSDIWEKGVYVS